MRTNKMKRLLAMALAFVLALGMTIPGFAAYGDGIAVEIGTYEEAVAEQVATPSDLFPEIQITSPAALEIVPAYAGIVPLSFPGGGSGTASDPWQISTIFDLDWMNDNVLAQNNFQGQHFLLINDITITAWSMIGMPILLTGGDTLAYSFNGTFDGGNHTVTLNAASQPFIHNTGMFRVIGNGGVVRNINIVGSLVGYNHVGSLAGQNFGTVENVTSTVTVGGTGGNIGGLIGTNHGAVNNAEATGNVTGASVVGGLVGFNQSAGTITSSRAYGDVRSNAISGGLVGNNWGQITGSPARGHVLGDIWQTGGLVGFNPSSGQITNSNAYGNVFIRGQVIPPGSAIVGGGSGTVTGSSGNGTALSAQVPVITPFNPYFQTGVHGSAWFRTIRFPTHFTLV